MLDYCCCCCHCYCWGEWAALQCADSGLATYGPPFVQAHESASACLGGESAIASLVLTMEDVRRTEISLESDPLNAHYEELEAASRALL